MGMMAFNLLTLYLLAEKGESLKEVKTLKTLRQLKSGVIELNPEMILYTESAFAIIRQNDLVYRALGLESRAIRKKLQKVFAPGGSKYG